MTLISVIVRTYRMPQYLEACVRALNAQARKPDEVIVVVRDTDTVSQEAVTQLQTELRKSLNVKVSIVHKSGHGASLDAGLEEASGNIVCFTDDDAEPWSDWIERIENHFQDPAIAGVGGRDIVIVDGEPIEGKCKVVGKMFWFGRYIGNHHLELQRDKSMEVDLLKGVNMAFRASYLKDFHFDENLDKPTSNNEIDICLFAKKKGGRLIFDPLLKVTHRVAPRFGGVRREETAKNVYHYSHNYTYVILKNFPWYRKIAFLIYIFLIGQRASLGLLTMCLVPLIKGKVACRGRVAASFKGKIHGIKTYLRWYRDKQERSRR